jgi:hypothetical protein
MPFLSLPTFSLQKKIGHTKKRTDLLAKVQAARNVAEVKELLMNA